MTNKSWDNDRKVLRELLKELRKDKAGLTQTELSEALGRPQSYVSKYENGERRLDYVEARDICNALGISMQSFNCMYDERLKEKGADSRSASTRA
jgi:transcriptional regulator with XRE-family HTH domain